MKNKKTLAVVVSSSILWAIMAFSAIMVSIATLFLMLVSVKTRHKWTIQWGVLFTFLAKHLCRVNYVVQGLDNLVPGPAIIASNHQSTWETVAFLTIFPQHVWILKRELLRIPFFGWAMAAVSPIAINRSDRISAAKQVLQQSTDRVKKNFWILVFPEGTRVAPGIEKPYKYGVGKMGLSLRLPIIPVAHNAGYLMPKGSFFLYPGVVSVVIGQPIYVIDDETPEALTGRIRHAIVTNLKPLLHNG